MSPNRVERRRMDREIKKIQRKEAKKASSSNSQHNVKKSKKSAPPKQAEAANQVKVDTVLMNNRVKTIPGVSVQTKSPSKAILASTKKKYAKSMGNAVSKAFRGKRLIAKCAYERIADMIADDNAGPVHARETALVIDDAFNNTIGAIITSVLVETDFNAEDFVDVIRDVLNDLVTDAIMETIGKFIDDQEFLCDVLALNVFEDIFKIVAKAIHELPTMFLKCLTKMNLFMMILLVDICRHVMQVFSMNLRMITSNIIIWIFLLLI